MDSAAVAISVRDFGVGLTAGEEQLVFDRFWRADPSRARTSGGTGLGLAIALEDARLHGGWLEAWGEPTKGSVFRLTLPRTVGGELQGSPLPLVPHPAEIEAAELPAVDADLPAIAGIELAGAVGVGPAHTDGAGPAYADGAGGPASADGAVAGRAHGGIPRLAGLTELGTLGGTATDADSPPASEVVRG
jgi:two-component system, OmpR family, sensor histidine kinase MtrB